MKQKIDYKLAVLFSCLVDKRMATGDSLEQARRYALEVLKTAVGVTA